MFKKEPGLTRHSLYVSFWLLNMSTLTDDVAELRPRYTIPDTGPSWQSRLNGQRRLIHRHRIHCSLPVVRVVTFVSCRM
jgi:hypothetical protein